MDQRIKDILPENTFGFEGYEVLAKNVTYIFEIPDENYSVTYELGDFINGMDIDHLYTSKLRACHAGNKVHIATHCNATGTPRGYVVNVSQEDANKLEKELLVFTLLNDTVWTVTKIDNEQQALDEKVSREKFINSLFTFE